ASSAASSLSGFRPTSTRWCPSAASWSDDSSPIPAVAPVTTIVLTWVTGSEGDAPRGEARLDGRRGRRTIPGERLQVRRLRGRREARVGREVVLRVDTRCVPVDCGQALVYVIGAK